ncbi:MAG: hypothetical protein Q9160_007441 [Pyrenula sp. 1 TL-2023]
MRASPSPLEGPITYTPTTHRVSKAKKGKRVHACPYPGCGKIFTRAEHRRRHELNHSTQPSFPCNRPGCRKAFHRPDLLARHVERHELESQSEESGMSPSRRRHTSQSSDLPPTMASSTIASPLAPVHTPTQSSSALSIGSLLHPPTTEAHGHAYSSSFGLTDSYGTSAVGPYSGYTYQSIDEPLLYSSTPESSQSPSSDYQARYPHRSSVSSSSSGFDMYGQAQVTPPLVSSTVAGWTPMINPPTALPQMLEHENSSYPSVVSVPLSDLDGHEWTVLRRELTFATGDERVEIFDPMRWDSCLECYWRHFHPFFPVVHRPSFFARSSSPLMAGAMVAIGSQYDTRANAKEYSHALLEACLKLLHKRDPINSRSRVPDLQTVFLLEALRLFRSKRAEVPVSSQFRVLYTDLTRSQQRATENPLALLRSSKENSPEKLKAAHVFWVERETRRRILHACFILDTHQSALFEQPPVIGRRPPPKISTTKISTTTLANEPPFPCDADLWDTSPIEQWIAKARHHVAESLPAAIKRTVSPYESTSPYSTFQSKLMLSHLIADIAQSPGTDNTEGAIDVLGQRLCNLPDAVFSYHAIFCARNTPVRNLLAVSGETWRFGKKLENEADFRDAKSNLRRWVESGDKPKRAVWHATQLLRLAFGSAIQQRSPELSMLYEQWALYLACLVCWAWGFDASTHRSPQPSDNASLSVIPPLSNNTSAIISAAVERPAGSARSSATGAGAAHPPLLDPTTAEGEMYDYLDAMNVERWHHLDRNSVNATGRFHGLLEIVRTRKLMANIGELLNEAERVLYRLVEGRSTLVHF